MLKYNEQRRIFKEYILCLPKGGEVYTCEPIRGLFLLDK